ncbi:MAG: hypothetical protein E3J72_12495 [Planctomycetota bacterium]|nr:MAG: hypothetical protein E3J72_12495 [Planctomycetota bacterium]
MNFYRFLVDKNSIRGIIISEQKEPFKSCNLLQPVKEVNMADEEYYTDDEFLDGEEFDEEEEQEFVGDSDLPWWVRKAPPLLISGGFHAIMLLIAAYIITTYIMHEDQITILAKREHKEQDYDPELPRAIFQTPRILADKLIEKPIIMLEEEVEITKDIPRGTSFDNLSNKNLNSTSVVDAFGVGGGASGAYGQRWGRGTLVKEGGGGTESVVVAGLRWLHFHQDKPKGNWDVDDYQKNCKGTGSPCSHMNNGQPPAATFDAGVSGLALLAFLGYGQTHRVGKFKRTVRRGLKYLKGAQQASGCFGHSEGESWIYNHALATMAMCEAYAVTRDNILKGPAQKAVDYMVQAQNSGYGWKYEPRDGRSDTSVTGWMVLALKAAKMGKLVIPQSAFDGAIAWFDKVTRHSDGKVGYMRPDGRSSKLFGRPPDTFKSMPTMTSVAVLCRIFCGQKRKHKKIQQGVDILMKNLPDWNKPKNDKVNFYYWYYATYAMFQVGGPKWKTWNEAMKKALIKTQRAGRICQDGSWDPVGEWCVVGGRCYATAINVLTLEIYYRFARAKAGR